MYNIKQENGITLTILVITIVMLIIIAGVSLNLGTFDVDSSLDAKLSGELKVVQNAVLQQYAKYKTTLDEDYIIKGSKTYSNEELASFMELNYGNIEPVYEINDDDEAYKKYYLLNSKDLVEIGIQDSQYSYIVNYYTGEVMNYDKYTTSGGSFLYVKGTNTTENIESF